MRWKLPKYNNSEKLALINERIHDKNDRRMFKLKLIDGMSLNEISNVLKQPYSTLRDHYYKQVKILFDDFPDPE